MFCAFFNFQTRYREGRKKGIFLFLTSQNPQDVSLIVKRDATFLDSIKVTHKSN